MGLRVPPRVRAERAEVIDVGGVAAIQACMPSRAERSREGYQGSAWFRARKSLPPGGRTSAPERELA